jgi:hypothetical protein
MRVSPGRLAGIEGAPERTFCPCCEQASSRTSRPAGTPGNPEVTVQCDFPGPPIVVLPYRGARGMLLHINRAMRRGR